MMQELTKLKNVKNAIILAHNYQPAAVQDMADLVGDSLALSQAAAKTDKDVIVFCGVRFMAETAKILSPHKKVLLPEPAASCSMAEMIDAAELRRKKAKYPDAAVVCYVNSSAEVKAESDICCTSSNAVKIVSSLDKRQVIFVPDRNLGQYVADQVPDKEFILWEGCCLIHCRVCPEDILNAKRVFPGAPVLVHPECNPEVIAMADFVGSTAHILYYARKCSAKTMLIGTEEGLLYQLERDNPDKHFFTLSSELICLDMKKTRPDDVLEALRHMRYEVEVVEDIRKRAARALEKMIV